MGLITDMIETMMEMSIWEYCMGYPSPSPKHKENEEEEDEEL